VTLSKAYLPSGWVEEILHVVKENRPANGTPIDMSTPELLEAGMRKLFAYITKIVSELHVNSSDAPDVTTRTKENNNDIVIPASKINTPMSSNSKVGNEAGTICENLDGCRTHQEQQQPLEFLSPNTSCSLEKFK